MTTPNHHLFTTVTPENLKDSKGFAEDGSAINMIFLYVGGPDPELDTRNVNLVRVDNIASARKGITRLSTVYGVLPAAIILMHEGSDGESAHWVKFFAERPEYASIPFFLHASDITEKVKSQARRFDFIDDVVTSQDIEGGLRAKISFVSRLKMLKMANPGSDNAVFIKYKGTTVGNLLKRTLDIVAASAGLVVASPVMITVAIMIRLESKGPIFYASPRAGRNYKVFKFYKFRTMVPDADKQLNNLKHLNQYDTNDKGPVFYKVSNDPRITKLGNFLRNTSLDEIPQLLNVLKGDMSLVGNRPLPLYEAKSLTTDSWVERFLAPAGITGLWQISKRGKKEMSVEERINLDIDYAYKNSFTYDMWLMVNTPRALIQKDNV